MNTEFFILLIVAVIVRYIPFVHIPFKMLSVYFHELGHGLVAITTGGSISKIVINYNGSGVCHYRYKSAISHFLISVSGYIATAAFGYYIYSVASTSSENFTTGNFYIILIGIAISTILWVRDIKTFILVSSIAFLFAIPILDEFIDVMSLLSFAVIYMKFIGMYIMIDALISPTYLIDGRDDGDGGDLAKMTKIPEVIWISLWLLISLYALYEAYMLG